MSRKSLVLGVDGGGTQSTALISDDAGNVFSRHQGGILNPSVAGFDATARALFQLITKCCDDVRSRPDELSSIAVGLSGVERETDRVRFREAVGGLYVKAGFRPPHLRVETDARIGLEAGFDGGPGVVIFAGNDSVVIGKTPRGEIINAGGWGRILGDEGSGYYIGREALVAIVQESDRRSSAGKLREVFAERFHWDSREKIITAVYQEKFDIASLAPVVLETAANNDIVAQRIVQRAATLLAEQARVVVMQMGILRKVGLVLSGALVESNSVYANVLHLKLLKLLPQVQIRPALHPPARGAVLIALDRLKKK